MEKAGRLLQGILLILIFSVSGFTQENPETRQEDYKYGIGIGAGFATGYGLSFRYHPQKFGAQVNFAPYKTEDTERYSAGVTFLYNIIESRITNLYIYQANHYFYNSRTQYIYNPDFPDMEEKIRTTESYFNNGLGFGMEIIIAKRIGFNLMTGYAFYENFEKLNLTGEAALYFKF